MESGDIVVMNHLDMTGGHTFFYVEDIRAYTDPSADSANIGTVHRAKVEASSTRGHTAAGDHRKNGNGAYWEVWCHAYSVLINGYDWTDPGDTVRVYRYPGGYTGGSLYKYGAFFLYNLLFRNRKHVRRLKGLI